MVVTPHKQNFHFGVLSIELWHEKLAFLFTGITLNRNDLFVVNRTHSRKIRREMYTKYTNNEQTVEE